MLDIIECQMEGKDGQLHVHLDVVILILPVVLDCNMHRAWMKRVGFKGHRVHFYPSIVSATDWSEVCSIEGVVM